MLQPKPRRDSLSAMEALAQKRGWPPSEGEHYAGGVRGEVDGHPVHVEVLRGRISVGLKQVVRVALREDASEPSDGFVPFSTGDAGFDGLFAHRAVDTALAKRFADPRTALAPVFSFIHRWRSDLHAMTVGGTLVVRFTQPDPKRPYIRGEILESVLFDLVGLAKALDAQSASLSIDRAQR